MKIVYIAGPYGDSGGYLAIERNIARAREAAVFLAERGIGFFCPHLNSAHFECIIEQPTEFWYEMDLRLLDACDAILMVEGWQNSNGARAELERAQRLGLPVLHIEHLRSLSGSESVTGRWLRENQAVQA